LEHKLIPRRSKAVADGAVLYYLDDNVHSRVSKLTYGVFCNTLYEPELPDHREREGKKITTIAGEVRIPNFFGIILKKVTLHLLASKDFAQHPHRMSKSAPLKNSGILSTGK